MKCMPSATSDLPEPVGVPQDNVIAHHETHEGFLLMRPRLYAAVGNPVEKQLERFVRRRKRFSRSRAPFEIGVRRIEAVGAFVRTPAPIAVVHRIRNKRAERAEAHRIVFRRVVFLKRPVSILQMLETDSPICSNLVHAGSPIHRSSRVLEFAFNIS